mgnify:CR=1 FL=1
MRNPEDFISEEGKVEWGRILNVKKTKELNEVFVDSISVNLNFKDIEQYHKILDEKAVELSLKSNIFLPFISADMFGIPVGKASASYFNRTYK